MATYSSYKKISAEGIDANAVDAADFSTALNATYGVKWFYGSPGTQTPGCCCLWTVPAGVKRLHIELWGSGGNGAGTCSCNRCHHFRGAGGGMYTSKMISTVEGCQYTVCAAGVYPCCSRDCTGCYGCASYVTGYNLTNFCAPGGMRGEANTSWSTRCSSDNNCCMGPNSYGSDFGVHTQGGTWSATEFVYDRGFCHCYTQSMFSGGAALIGTDVQTSIRSCWHRCGCWTVPYGSGGQTAMSTQCGSSCCGQGGTGGGGLVKITYF